MRPIKLTMSAFGPYGSLQVIDFSKLDNKNIFLINGPTGAGKTTIFDAISYALFGKASSSERDGDNLRSHFAKDDMLTYVELEFEARGKRYYIKRIPKQKKKKIRGEGFTEQKADAEFKEEGEKLITGVGEVNNRVSKLMGMNYEQFKQIVMIPQGKFRDLILADSKERETIFREIFGTYEFQRIQQNLDSLSKNLRLEIQSLVDKRDAYIKKIDPNKDEVLTGLLSAQNINITAVIDNTKKLLLKDKKIQNSLKECKKKLNLQYESLQQELFKAIENNKKFENKDKIEYEKNKLESKKDEYNLKEEKLNKARKALKIKSSEDYYINRRENVDALHKDLIKAKEEKEKSRQILEDSKQKLNVEKNKEEERNALQKSLAYLEKDIDKVKDYEKRLKTINELKMQTKNKNDEIEKVKKNISSMKAKLEHLSMKLNDSKEAAVKCAQYDKILNHKKIIYNKLLKLNQECEKLKEIREKLIKKRNVFKQIDEKFISAREKYEHSNDIYIRGQAGILAQNLIENEPCPVCGSTIHPNPAKNIKGIPSQDDIKKYKEEYQNIEKKHSELYNEITKLNTIGLEQKNLIDDIKKELSEYLKDEDTTNNYSEKLNLLEKKELEEFVISKLESIKDEVVLFTDKLKSLTKKKDMQPQLLQQIEIIQKNINKQEVKQENLEKEYVALYSKYQSENNMILKLERELPKGVHSYKELQERLNDVKSKFQLMNKSLEDAVEKNRKAELQYNSCCINVKNKLEALESAKLELKNAEMQFKHNVNLEGFSSVDEYYSSKLSDSEIQKLETDIRNYGQSLKSIKDAYEKVLEEIKGLKIEDTSVIKDKIKDNQNKAEKIDEELNKLYGRIRINENMIKDINKINKKLGDKESKYRIVGHLASVAKGDNIERISFERYVLAAYFDDIIKAANIRFYKMTNGRYILHRIRERTKGRAQQGLELEVYDNNTGKYRHVKTLSGGESFKASLSLALGLADIVQANAGGINIETMFVDEGFGTLDPDSLDAAIECLLELQKNGRLIGIISHVPELKERIDARIEITPQINGSRADIIV